MKKILNFILTLTLVSLCSCNYVLDIAPITEQTEDQFYNTESDAFQALVAVYDPLQWDTYEMYAEVMSDNCYGGGASANDIIYFVKMAQGNLDPADPNISTIWSKFYSGIYRANLLLEKLPEITFDSEETRERIEAECYFLRAYYYWGLARTFGNVPLILKTLEPSEYYTQMQSTPQEVFAQIKEDMYLAIEGGLPRRTELASSEAGRITLEAAQAMMVRIWMFYNGVYSDSSLNGMTKSDAITMIKEVIAYSGCSLNEDFADNFDVNKKNGVESLFEIQYTMESSWGDWTYLQGSDGNFAVIRWGIRDVDADSPYSSGWSFAPVRASLWDDYEDGDSRREATLINMNEEGWSYTPGYQNTGIFNRKFTPLKDNYPSSGGSAELNYSNNIPVIRYSDVLLMAAELLVDSDVSSAQSYYDIVVKRAMGDSYSASTVTLDGIRTERHKEFALEGIRYWDLLRYGLDYAKSVIESENDKLADATKNKTFNVTKAGFWPIPEDELIQCQQLNQNTGY